MKRPLVVRGMWGLGDSIFQRPFIRALTRRNAVFLETPWPELYTDLPIEFLRPAARALRTQTDNVRRQPPGRFSKPPRFRREIEITYGHADFASGDNIVQAMQRRVGLEPSLPFDLPDVGTWRVTIDKPIALIRPVTLRQEWQNEARNPLPKYVAQAEALLRARGFHTVVVANLKEGHEWLKSGTPAGSERFLNGELTTLQLLALARASSIICGGVGWIVPASIAASVPAFVIMGGQGAHNAPAVITDPRMNLSKIEFAIPKDFCQCSDMAHKCNSKTIEDLAGKLSRFLDRVVPHCSTNSRADV